MSIAEKLEKKLEEKVSEDKKGKIDSGEWLLLFFTAGFIDILYIFLTIIGLIPIVGQVMYVIITPLMGMIITGAFWLFLQRKGLGKYWGLAFGGGMTSLVPVANWLSWTISVFILYSLTKAEKAPLVGEAMGKISAITKVK